MRLMLIWVWDRWPSLNFSFILTWFLIIFNGLNPPGFVDNALIASSNANFGGSTEVPFNDENENKHKNNISTSTKSDGKTRRPLVEISDFQNKLFDNNVTSVAFYRQTNNLHFNSRQKFDRIFGRRNKRKHNSNFGNSFQNNNVSTASSSWAIRIPIEGIKPFSETLLRRPINTSHLHAKASQIAFEAGLINHGPIGGLLGHYYLVHKSFYTYNLNGHGGDELEEMRSKITLLLKNHPGIEWVRHENIRMRYKRTLEFKDQFFPSQWHLDNLKFVGHDINVTGVWEHNVTGRGIVVSVIDDGVEWTNPDILDNYSSEGSWDLNSNDGDPMPRVDEAGLNHHGTRCAGEIAAVANEYCAVGVAYGAKVSGVRILDGPMTDSLEAMAFNTKMEINDIYSCSWGPDDNGKTVDGPHQLAQAALAHGVMAGRQGYGSIFVVASGNGGHFQDNCNFDGYANSIFTVTIGAVDELGQMPYYAEHCAAMLAVTYSSGQGHQRNIVTTDWRLGSGTGCTDRHTGTSAAAPLAAGMLALMLEVRHCLTWRDVQHIIVFTAVKVNIDEEEWHMNGAGFHHSHKHGFGLLNSWILVMTSKLWPNVPYLTSWSSPVLRVRDKIPLAGELTKIYPVDQSMADEVVTMEHVTVTVNIKHSCRGNLAINLISPEGTISKLATTRKYDRSSEGFVDWTFSTVRCWGEHPQGLWKIVITDSGDAASPGTLKDWRLTFYGSSMTHREIEERKRLVKKALGGRYFYQPGPPCPPPPSPFIQEDVLSPRILKILLLLSGFVFLLGLYFLLETVCDSSGGFNTIKESRSEVQTPDSIDLNTFLPKELTEEDQIRLTQLLEQGSLKIVTCPDTSFQADSIILTPDSLPKTPDEMTRFKEFEERLKNAMEQSIALQTRQINQIKTLELELADVNNIEGLGPADVVMERTDDSLRKNKRKLKGILKKPKQYKE